MKRSKRNLLLFVGAVIAILVITNPTNSDFDRYLRAKGFAESVHGGRVNYFFVCSIFEVNFRYGRNNENNRNIKFFGFLGNFIKIVDTR